MASEAEQAAFRMAAARARGTGQAALDAGSIDIETWLRTYIFTNVGPGEDDEDDANEAASRFKMPRRVEPASEHELLMSLVAHDERRRVDAPAHSASVAPATTEDAPRPRSVYEHALAYRTARTPPLAHIETVAAASGLLRALATNVGRHVRAVNASTGDERRW